MTAWWHRRTLHARLSLLVTGAVAVAVLAVAAVAFTAVGQIQHRQIESQLNADAQAIAARPEQWRDSAATLPGGTDETDHGPAAHRRPRDLGARWQIIGADGKTVSDAATLPITAAAREVLTGRSRSAQEQVIIGDDRYLMLTVPATGGGAVQVAINQDPAARTLAQLGLLLAAGCALGIAGAALLGRAVARAGLRPVQRLADAVGDVAVTMDLTRPVPVHGADDEIARLGRSVNTMLGAIDSARRAQRTLVEDAGHELRTPLTSIRTNVELLLTIERHPELAHRLPPEERAKLLADLEAQVRELATLTTELVELAREETTREAAEPVGFADVVTAAIERVRIRAPGLAFAAGLAPVTVHGRPGELERMVVNVLDNAAKWSPAGATVGVELRAEGGGCVLAVADTGPGIDEADRPHVFDRFYRAAAARSMPGSGLGLAIVEQTATQHGGSVAVAPNNPHGTVVTIRLPGLPGGS